MQAEGKGQGQKVTDGTVATGCAAIPIEGNAMTIKIVPVAHIDISKNDSVVEANSVVRIAVVVVLGVVMMIDQVTKTKSIESKG